MQGKIIVLADFPQNQAPLQSLLAKADFAQGSYLPLVFLPAPPPEGELSKWVSDRKTPPDPAWSRLHGSWVHPTVAAAYARLEGALAAFRPSEGEPPPLVIAFGPAALWALTGESSLIKWRGSRLSSPLGCTVLPTYHPAAVSFRQPELRHIILSDLRRARAIHLGTQTPRSYSFLISPSREEVLSTLSDLLESADKHPLLLSGDLETRQYHIACFGIAWSPTDALCIHFLRANSESPFFWDESTEVEILLKIHALFRHPNITWIGQNFLYDCQYFHRFWGVVPSRAFDTMIGHHSIYPNMRKGLDFLSSIYAQDHVYWKDEIKEWDPAIGEKQYWTYNCKDACITWEIYEKLQIEQAKAGVSEHFLFQQSLFFPVLRMMNRGIRIDLSSREKLRKELISASLDRQERLDFMAGHPLNPNSSPQLVSFFYKDLGLPVLRALTSASPTANSSAMAEIAVRCPPLKPLCQTIVELRSIRVFLSTFINADLDRDSRMRCTFAIAGPTTFRFSSSENAFGSGMNLQNVPVEEKAKIKSDDYIKLPNIRKLFIPDPGFEFFDMDLDRADLQVVVWEADDSDLKKVLRLGLDLHCVNACTIFDLKGIPFEELAEGHPNYPEHRARIGSAFRQKAKMGVHATNYGVGDRKLAQSLGITVHEASLFRARWFAAHPGIKKWHERTEASARTRGEVRNAFNARLPILGNFDLPEALAWIPQSTVARVINTALSNIDAAERRGETAVQLLIQVHDSLAGQYPISLREKSLSDLRRLAEVRIPYPDPLIIPVGINTSQSSWGGTKS